MKRNHAEPRPSAIQSKVPPFSVHEHLVAEFDDRGCICTSVFKNPVVVVFCEAPSGFDADVYTPEAESSPGLNGNANRHVGRTRPTSMDYDSRPQAILNFRR